MASLSIHFQLPATRQLQLLASLGRVHEVCFFHEERSSPSERVLLDGDRCELAESAASNRRKVCVRGHIGVARLILPTDLHSSYCLPSGTFQGSVTPCVPTAPFIQRCLLDHLAMIIIFAVVSTADSNIHLVRSSLSPSLAALMTPIVTLNSKQTDVFNSIYQLFLLILQLTTSLAIRFFRWAKG